MSQPLDAIVIGGGFYGAVIAVYLSRSRGLRRVVLVEREADLLQRASLHNQARVHNGYHYPRSFTTAYRSRVNLPRFVADWPSAVSKDFAKIYAIARRNSKTTARQFERFCHEIGATLRPVHQSVRRLFEPRLVEAVYQVEEYAFDATQLAVRARAELGQAGVVLRLSTRATAISRGSPGQGLRVSLQSADGLVSSLDSRLVFNCTYSGLNQLGGDYCATQACIKHELTEMALMQMPAPLEDLGITVMDGPFFSLMPYPARGLHTLSHVRYTPHISWADAPGLDPYRAMAEHGGVTRVDRMLRDAARYLPSLRHGSAVESMFEVKSVLMRNEGDDGRPILLEQQAGLPGCYSILGGKVDNIYDVLERLDGESLEALVHAR